MVTKRDNVCGRVKNYRPRDDGTLALWRSDMCNSWCNSWCSSCSKSIYTGINAQNLYKWLPNWDNPRGSSLQELIKSNLLLESRADQNTFPRFVDVFELLVLSRRAVTGSLSSSAVSGDNCR